jgi:hypothetical protein
MLPMSNPPLTRSRPATWAEVRTHGRVMRYRQSGSGPAVLLLRQSDRSNRLWPELRAALHGDFRLLEPDIPGDTDDVARWIADFLEGLGLSGVSVIATDAFCIPALELALLGADQVARAVLVPDGLTGETGLDGTLTASIHAATVALLVVRAGAPAEDAVPLVTGFLAGQGSAVAG